MLHLLIYSLIDLPLLTPYIWWRTGAEGVLLLVDPLVVVIECHLSCACLFLFVWVLFMVWCLDGGALLAVLQSSGVTLP